MNERIRELKQQSIDYVDSIDDGLKLDHYKELVDQKFAELIVLECSDVLLKWKNEPFPFDEDLAVSLIKEHFGIKK